jgi:voltage-gated potassium channel
MTVQGQAESGRQTRQASSVSLGRMEYLLQLLIVATLVSLALETLPGLTSRQQSALDLFERVAMGVFTVEYLVRIWLTRPWHRYVFSFYGAIDLLSILPFLLCMGTEALRALRLMRLFRLFKLARYNAAMLRFYRALVIAREEMALFGSMALILLYLSGVGMYHFEHKAQPEAFASVFDGLWWALCTLTTVGYGDVYPVTMGGKLFTFFILVVGLGLVAVPVGLVASALSQAREEIRLELQIAVQGGAAGSPLPESAGQHSG